MKIALLFLLLAVAAGVAGFWLAIELVADVAKLPFYAFVVGFLYFFVRHIMRGKGEPHSSRQ